MTQTQKDFLALSHGQEWVTFYESFDKLVQDNLSRSSELLRRAMALPEVADREVQQIRTEMEEKLANERSRQREVLSGLKEDLSGSYRQVSMLARSVGTVIGDLERLSQRVNEAIATFDTDPAPAAAGTLPAAVANGVAYANGAASVAPAAHVPPTPVAPPPVAEAPVFAEPEIPSAEFEDLGLPKIEDLSVDLDVDDVTAAVEEQEAMLKAAEQQLDNLEAAIDLSALAEAEVEPAPAVDPATPAAESALSGDQRPRPHWLSVTRPSAKQ
jgi:hypothetical protein